jgi:hypothetical protein
MADCFIVMPLTTPDIATYANDAEHFRHVLDHLFVPAITKAGLEPVLPVVEGADVIHAEIIRNIERVDLVLCDMSSLNPNVFFELGIRTAVNKPVCLVKDDATPKVPFDTTIINYHTYLSGLTPWTLERQISDLALHIKKSIERSKHQNTMWKYFGLSSRAELPTGKTNSDERLEFLSLQIASLSQRLDEAPVAQSPKRSQEKPELSLFHKLIGIAASANCTVNSGEWDDKARTMTITVEAAPDTDTTHELLKAAALDGYHLTIRVKSDEHS